MNSLDPDVFMAFAVIAIPSIALFSFLAVAAWAGSRSEERKAYYKNDMLKKLADSPASGASATLEYLREQERTAERKRRGGMQLGGIVTAAVGIGLMAFLGAITRHHPVFFVGLIPLLVGIALFGYAQFIMRVE